MKSAIVTGLGQDGYYLSKQLLEKGCEVTGVTRWQCKGYNKQLKELMAHTNFTLREGDITDKYFMHRVITDTYPDAFFNTAAISHVAISFDIPEITAEANYLAVLRILEELRAHSPHTAFLQCSTSEQFGDNTETPQTENSKMSPVSPYAIAKQAAYQLTRLYRKHGMKTYNTICFNHESEIRPDNFVTRKITKGMTDIKKGKIKSFTLGNLDAYRDWGYAPDYTKAMIDLVEAEKPGEYVLCTGETHTVREFIQETAKNLNMIIEFDINIKGEDIVVLIDGIERRPIIYTSTRFHRPAEVDRLCGSYEKINKEIGWKPTTTFKELVKIMVEHDMG